MTGDVPTVAVLTPPGRGAVATLRLRGPVDVMDRKGLFAAARGGRLGDQPLDRVLYGQWGVEAPEDVVVCRTGEQTTEIHCHGGVAAVERIVTDLHDHDVQRVTWQSQSVMDRGWIETECLEAVAAARTARSAAVLSRLTNGRLQRHFEHIREYAERENWSALEHAVSAMTNWADFSRHLIEPYVVAVIGRPNVGKSSLTNALLGYDRSIVYDEPGTTRDVVRAETAFDGRLVQFADTAGMRETANVIEAEGVERAKRAASGADLVIVVCDGSQPLAEADRQLLTGTENSLSVLNKCDLPLVAELPGDLASAINVSTVNGVGIPELIEAMMRRLVPAVPNQDDLMPANDRQRSLLASITAAIAKRNRVEVQQLLSQLLHGDRQAC